MITRARLEYWYTIFSGRLELKVDLRLTAKFSIAFFGLYILRKIDIFALKISPHNSQTNYTYAKHPELIGDLPLHCIAVLNKLRQNPIICWFSPNKGNLWKEKLRVFVPFIKRNSPSWFILEETGFNFLSILLNALKNIMKTFKGSSRNSDSVGKHF